MVCKSCDNFISEINGDFNTFEISMNEDNYGKTLRKTLAYTDMGRYSEAIQYAKYAMEMGDSGGMIIDGKEVLEYLTEYFLKILT